MTFKSMTGLSFTTVQPEQGLSPENHNVPVNIGNGDADRVTWSPHLSDTSRSVGKGSSTPGTISAVELTPTGTRNFRDFTALPTPLENPPTFTQATRKRSPATTAIVGAPLGSATVMQAASSTTGLTKSHGLLPSTVHAPQKSNERQDVTAPFRLYLKGMHPLSACREFR